MSKRLLVTAFVVGAVVHALLLAGAFYGPMKEQAATGLLIFALPGAIVDMSSELFQPKGAGTVAVVAFATLVNGGAYAAVAALASLVFAKVFGGNAPRG